MLLFLAENGEEDFELAGTVELTFNRKGANANAKDSLYICNMAVRKNPSEERYRLASTESRRGADLNNVSYCPSREFYLHCRIIDEAPFNMYTKTGYIIDKADSFLTVLTLQRWRHLMHKVLPTPKGASTLDGPM